MTSRDGWVKRLSLFFLTLLKSPIWQPLVTHACNMAAVGNKSNNESIL